MIVVLLPICGSDSAIMLDNLQWQSEIDQNERCVLSIDKSTDASWVDKIRRAAFKAFRTVLEFTYDPPRSGTWPPNTAFREACYFMAKQAHPWLFMEADAIPLCAGWLGILEHEYEKRGKAFMGVIIPGLWHSNGVAIYPPNAASLMPRTMREQHEAFDLVASHQDGINHPSKFWNTAPLMPHFWTVQPDGKLHPFEGGAAPTFSNPETIKQIPVEAVLMHRCKDGTLTRQLRGFKAKI